MNEFLDGNCMWSARYIILAFSCTVLKSGPFPAGTKSSLVWHLIRGFLIDSFDVSNGHICIDHSMLHKKVSLMKLVEVAAVTTNINASFLRKGALFSRVYKYALITTDEGHESCQAGSDLFFLFKEINIPWRKQIWIYRKWFCEFPVS